MSEVNSLTQQKDPMNLTPAQLAAICEAYRPGYATCSPKLRTIIRHDVACVLAAIEASGHVVISNEEQTDA